MFLSFDFINTDRFIDSKTVGCPNWKVLKGFKPYEHTLQICGNSPHSRDGRAHGCWGNVPPSSTPSPATETDHFRKECVHDGCGYVGCRKRITQKLCFAWAVTDRTKVHDAHQRTGW